MPKTKQDLQRMGDNIQKLRKSVGMSQEKFAEHIGISRTHIGHIEQGRKEASLQLLQRIAKALKVKVNELIPF